MYLCSVLLAIFLVSVMSGVFHNFLFRRRRHHLPIMKQQDSLSSLFPREPKLVPGCSVKFQHSNMSLCYNSSDDETLPMLIGPAIVTRLLEYHFGCNASDVHLLDLANDKESRTNRSCLFVSGSGFRHAQAGDHVWGSGLDEHSSLNKSDIAKGMHIHSVRGPDTERIVKEWYGMKEKISHGDPGTVRRDVVMWQICQSNEFFRLTSSLKSTHSHSLFDSKSLSRLLSLANKINWEGTRLYSTSILFPSEFARFE